VRCGGCVCGWQFSRDYLLVGRCWRRTGLPQLCCTYSSLGKLEFWSSRGAVELLDAVYEY